MPNNESQGPPPAEANEEAKQATWKTAKSVAAKDPAAIRGLLDQRRPVVLSVLTFPSWDFGVTAETGEIAMPFPGETSDGGHAICLVGCLATWGGGQGAYSDRPPRPRLLGAVESIA